MGVALEELVVRRGRRTVLEIESLELGAGVTVLVGPNGAGKSTLIGTAATLLRPDSGRIEIAGIDLGTAAGRRRARSRLGYVGQHPEFPGNVRVADAVGYAAWLHRVPRAQRADSVEATLRAMGLVEFRDQRVGALSGGTRQRVFIAQAVVHDPQVLLFDEVTVGVDAEHRVELRRLIRSIATERTVLLSTHLTEDIELLADRVVALSDGRVCFDGTTAELLDTTVVTGTGADERPIESALRLLASGASRD